MVLSWAQFQSAAKAYVEDNNHSGTGKTQSERRPWARAKQLLDNVFSLINRKYLLYLHAITEQSEERNVFQFCAAFETQDIYSSPGA